MARAGPVLRASKPLSPPDPNPPPDGKTVLQYYSLNGYDKWAFIVSGARLCTCVLS